ncbi:uncharacterized protein LOC118278943 isoform X2 [Spodoptera frugiperda]|uniref:Uncharacterized protein LOC118278943 isoform X2 n=1 Tax=Spodoptera frugiperda TaxID=7108 RepID=A0A9R0E5A6_SPOFR|nr:uncharacterized protein LOC118278943 isoform X2 [Spodoptera frugiperda]
MDPSYYKSCIVPQCTSTSIKTPEKLFIYVPHNQQLRKKWLTLARRKDAHCLSSKSRMYFCEDHFDLPNDMLNYTEYHIMGKVSQVRMRPNCIPCKFACQEDRRKRTCNSTVRSYVLKKQRKTIIEECLKEQATQSSSHNNSPHTDSEFQTMGFEEPKNSCLLKVDESVQSEISCAAKEDKSVQPIEDLKNYHQHKLINQEPRLKPTASFRRVTPNKSVNSPALLKLLLQDTSTTNKQLKSKYEDTIMPSTSSYSTLPMTSEEKHEASADKIRCPKCSTEIETKQYVQLPLDALICQPCFLLLDTEAGEHERLLGHTMVCVGCGKSVRRIKQYHNVNMECPLLAVLISQNTYYVPSRNNYVCHMCWIRANRQAVVDSTHDMQELASDNMQDLASNNNAAAPPDVQEDRVNAILVNVYKYFATEGTELSPSQLRERTALCTGASEADVECALVLHQEVSATQKPLRKPPRKRRKKESKSPPPIQEEEPYIERETLIVTVDPKAGDANSEINPLAIKEEQPSSPITCEQDASLCEPQQSGLKPEDMAKVFVKTEPTEEPNS